MTSKLWLILEKSDETRVYGGKGGYDDNTGKKYNYDNLVPNHKNIKTGDVVIIRKENVIIGFGMIENISKEQIKKDQYRCPECDRTSIKQRKKRIDKFKCGNCKLEFNNPKKNEITVTAYSASIINFFTIPKPPSVADLKRCAVTGDGTKSQLSMMQLDLNRAKELIPLLLVEADTFEEAEKPESTVRTEGGIAFYISQKIERNPELRAAAIRIHGFDCAVCGFNFEKKYGDLGKNWAEVHHRRPLSESKGEKRTTDPSKDLVVLCANCHRMIHRKRGKILTEVELRGMLRD